MKFVTKIFLLFCAALIVGPTTSFAFSRKPPAEVKPAPVESVPPVSYGSVSWEKNHPERKAWSEFVFGIFEKELFDTFDSAKDAKRICPKYAGLTRSQKILVWGELVSAMAYFESGWSPTSRMTETTMGIDPVTGKRVESEGLLQLSYQDVPNYGSLLKYPLCKIDWQKDKNLSAADPKKTILDPYVNLECGLRILGSQITKKGNVILSSGVYWSVLKDGGKYSKVQSILKMVSGTGLCN
jgi:hypothetical protein